MTHPTKLEDVTKTQALGLAIGAAQGALTGTPFPSPKFHRPGMPVLAAQVGSAAAAAARNGAGVGGSLAAGSAVVTAKAAAVWSAAAAAAPVAIGVAVVGAAGYGLYRFFKSL